MTIEIEFPATIIKNSRQLKQTIQFTFSPMNELFSSLHVLRTPRNHETMISWELRAQVIIKNILQNDFDFFGPIFDYTIPSFMLPILTNKTISMNTEFKLLQNRLYNIKKEEIIDYFLVVEKIKRSEFLKVQEKKLELINYNSREFEKIQDIFLKSPKEFSDRFISFLRKYNELIFNDIWEESHIKNILTEEIVKQSQNILTQGVSATIIALKNDKIYWAGKKLMLYEPLRKNIQLSVKDKIYFLPSYFVWPHLFVSAVEGGTGITYAVNLPITNNFTPEKMQLILSAVGDTTRIQILNFLKQTENTTQGLAQLLSLSESNVAHHLSLLKATDLVSHRRVGKYVLYKITPVITNLIPSFFDNLPNYYLE
ncbi:ArsR/SmtB family transcription factor [Leuconostoc sp. MS02]|uniref:ArsR/SmtB family transcription factor n=1 Tax=Leuconostoc aquikimchii TaxID=3236804 RepID=A0ABV3S855_9LACO